MATALQQFLAKQGRALRALPRAPITADLRYKPTHVPVIRRQSREVVVYQPRGPIVNTAATAVKPIHTPTLLEQMPTPKYTGEQWVAYCASFVKESQDRRRGVKANTPGLEPEQIYSGPWAEKLKQLRALQ